MAVNTQVWVQSSRVRQLTDTDDWTKSKPRFLIGCQLLADEKEWLEDENVNVQTEQVISWVVVTNQNDWFGFEKKRYELDQKWYKRDCPTRKVDVMMIVTVDMQAK